MRHISAFIIVTVVLHFIVFFKCYIYFTASISADDDVLQCGKCKKQFTSIFLFLNHKKEHAAGQFNKLYVQEYIGIESIL